MIDVGLICTIFGIFILFSFIKGIEIGRKMQKDEPIELTLKSPLQFIREQKEKKKQSELEEKEEAENEINLHNIDIYDGTGLGQKDFR